MSKRDMRWVAWLGAIALALGLTVVLPGVLLGVALIAGSQRTVFERAESPDGQKEARVQFDDAGAISSVDRIVFVKDRWNPSDEPLFSCRAFWADGENAIHLRWADNRTLEIRHGFPSTAIEAQAARCGSVRIIALSGDSVRAASGIR